MIGIILANLLYNTLATGLLLVAALLTAGYSLALPWGEVLFLMIIVALHGLGIGWMVAGLSLNFKRIESMHTLLQPMFIGILAIPWELHPLVRLIPLRWPRHLMERVLESGPAVVYGTMGCGGAYCCPAVTLWWDGVCLSGACGGHVRWDILDITESRKTGVVPIIERFIVPIGAQP